MKASKQNKMKIATKWIHRAGNMMAAIGEFELAIQIHTIGHRMNRKMKEQNAKN